MKKFGFFKGLDDNIRRNPQKRVILVSNPYNA